MSAASSPASGGRRSGRVSRPPGQQRFTEERPARRRKAEASPEKPAAPRAKSGKPKAKPMAKAEAEPKAKAKPKAKPKAKAKAKAKKGKDKKPKRGSNAFMHYLKEQRARLSRETGGGAPDVSRAAGAEWRGMGEAERAPYERKAQKERARLRRLAEAEEARGEDTDSSDAPPRPRKRRQAAAAPRPKKRRRAAPPSSVTLSRRASELGMRVASAVALDIESGTVASRRGRVVAVLAELVSRLRVRLFPEGDEPSRRAETNYAQLPRVNRELNARLFEGEEQRAALEQEVARLERLADERAERLERARQEAREADALAREAEAGQLPEPFAAAVAAAAGAPASGAAWHAPAQAGADSDGFGHNDDEFLEKWKTSVTRSLSRFDANAHDAAPVLHALAEVRDALRA